MFMFAAPSRFLNYFFGLVFISMAAMWAPSAMAQPCIISLSGPSSVAVNTGETATYSISAFNTGGCGATSLGVDFSPIFDNTGSITLPSGVLEIPLGTTVNFTVIAGNLGGQSASFRATCVTGCSPTDFIDYTLTTNNNYNFTGSGATQITNQLRSFNLSTRLLVNGVASGATYGTSFSEDSGVLTSLPGPIFVANDALGNASLTLSEPTVGTFDYRANVSCAANAGPNCPPATVTFNVTVEAVSLTAFGANSFTIAPGDSITLTAQYGSASVPATTGIPLTWSFAGGPPGAAGFVSQAPNTDLNGRVSAVFSANVPGAYSVSVSDPGNASVVDRSESFTVIVTSSTLDIASGNLQSGPVGTVLPAQLAVVALDNGSIPPSVSIDWTTTAGTLAAGSSLTDPGTGIALNTLTLPATAGTVTVTARRSDNGTAFATFTATATAALATIDAVDDSVSTPAITPVSTTVVSNDTATGGAINADSVSLTLGAANGTASVSEIGGVVTYTPNPGFAGIDTYTYRVCLAAPNATVCDTAVVTINVIPTITAVNDPPLGTIPATGGTTITSVYANDTTNGLPVVIGTNARFDSAGGTLSTSFNSTTGLFTLPALAPGGYSYSYTICTLPDTVPETCSTSSGTLFVTAIPTITAVNDTFAAIPSTGGATPSVIANDTTNGVAASLGTNVSLTPGASPNAGLAMNVDGAITVVEGTAAGTYVYPYTICTIPATVPETCSTANATVVVGAVVPTINAVDDSGLTTQAATSLITDVLDNDGFTGGAIDPASVTVLILSPDFSTSVNTSTGAITFTPALGFVGTNTYQYRVCLQAPNAGICDTAVVTITVIPTITAVNDSFAAIPSTGGATPSVIANDTTNGVAASLGTNVSLTPGASPNAGLAMNVDGAITVVEGTPAGTYVYPYTICTIPATVPETCSTANATVTVTAAVVVRTVSVSSGNNQTGTVGTALPLPLVVLVQDNGVASPNNVINWTTTGGTLSAESSLADTIGLATINLTLPATAGVVTVTGTRADDNTVFATFTATATALPVVRTLSVSSGNNQSATVGNTLLQPLVVLAQDNGANAANISINWTATGGTLSAPSSLTDAGGLASVNLTLPATAGVVTVTGTRADDNTVVATFTATATAVVINQTLVTSSPASGTATANAGSVVSLSVLAQDNAVNAGNITVNWTTSAGTLAPNSITTPGTGVAINALTLPATAGVITVTATRADNNLAVATFTITSTLVRTLAVVSGSGQSAAPGSTLAAPLVVLAQNNGVAANAVGINWTITAGSTLGAAANTTAATGQASNTVTLGATTGVVTITATRQDDPTATVTFTVNNVVLGGIPNLNPGQTAVAGALDVACGQASNNPTPTPAELDFIQRCRDLATNAATNPGAVTAALQELLPDAQVAQSNSSFATASRQFEIISSRIATLRAGAKGTDLNALMINGPKGGGISLGSIVNGLSADETPTKTEANSDFQRWGFFLSGSIGRGESDATDLAPRYKFDVNSLTAGLDYRYSDALIFGAALGYNQQDTNLALGQGGVDTNSYTLSAYGSYFRSSSWYTDASLTFGKNQYDLIRQISYTVGGNTVNQTARATSDGDQLSLGLTFGRDYQKAGWTIGPYGRILYTQLDFDQVEERIVGSTTGSGLALIIEERGVDSLASVVGTKFIRPISLDWGVLTPTLQLEWEHEFNDDPGAAVARFANDPSRSTILLKDSPTDTDFFRIGLGLSAVMSKGRSGFVYYDKIIGRDGVQQDNVTLGIRIEF
jgi:uncharacterized protein with beta-barrel porin domain